MNASKPHVPQTAVPASVSLADFRTESVSADVRHVANGVIGSPDSVYSAFYIVGKKSATLYVFDGLARLRASSPVLLGAVRGDHAVPGIGLCAMANILPAERTTSAGRFIAEDGRNGRGEDSVWVYFDAAISMQRVRTTTPKERRLERLATATVEDNRISHGRINVPDAFYESYIRPIVANRRCVGQTRATRSDL